MSNGARLDRLEKARGDGVMSRKVGSCYASASVYFHWKIESEYDLHHWGNTLAKVIVDPETRVLSWADDINDPNARWAEHSMEHRWACVYALSQPSPHGIAPRFTEDEVQAAWDLIISELEQGITPEVRHR